MQNYNQNPSLTATVTDDLCHISITIGAAPIVPCFALGSKIFHQSFLQTPSCSAVAAYLFRNINVVSDVTVVEQQEEHHPPPEHVQLLPTTPTASLHHAVKH